VLVAPVVDVAVTLLLFADGFEPAIDGAWLVCPCEVLVPAPARLEQACNAARAGKTLSKLRLVVVTMVGAEEFEDFVGRSKGTKFIGVLKVEACFDLIFFCILLHITKNYEN
jgi:hypothetical protein